MTPEEEKLIYQAGRSNLVDFSILTNPAYKPAWIHEEVARQLMRIESGEIKRLMLFVPPRYGKSELGSINFPAYFLGRHPKKEVIVSSYSAELAQDFGYKTRNLVNEKSYQDIFDTKLREDSQSKAKWLTQEGGGYTSVGVGGAITGRGADLFLIDDPLKNREEAESKLIRDKVWNWYTSTAYTRLEKDAAVVLIMTRWHLDDLAGRLLKAQAEGGEQWEVLDFPAIATHKEKYRDIGEPLWPEKYDLTALEATKKTVGTYDWSSLYQQNPVIKENQEFKPAWFKEREQVEVDNIQTRKFLTIDTAISKASSADFTGICDNAVDINNFWNIKAWKVKVDPKELIDLLFTLQDKNHYEKIGIEKTIYTMVIKPFLDDEQRKRNKFLPIVDLHHNQVQKELRIRGLIPRYESGSIFHIKGECVDLEDDLLTFPRGLHDDVADATAYQLQIAEAPFNDTEQQMEQVLNRQNRAADHIV